MDPTPADMIKLLIHSEGISRVTMDNNRQIVSSGHDSSIIFYKQSLNEDSYQFEVDGIASVQDIVCYHRDEQYYVAIATDENTVLSYKYSSGNVNDDPFAESEFESLLVRFTSQINTIDVSLDNTKLAAGASDFLVKIVDLIDTCKVTTLEGHEAPILCVQFDPLGMFLASSSCDGTVKIWSIDNKDMITSLNVFTKVNDLSLCPTLCRLSWQPSNGKILAIPVGECVELYERETWKCLKKLQDNSHEEPVNVTCWSPCGEYIAVGRCNGHVSIWSFTTSTLLYNHNTEAGIISSLFWDPTGPDSAHPLIFSSSFGHLGSLPKQIVYPNEGGVSTDKINTNKHMKEDDPLIDDSLLMEGIPPDSIFDDDDDIINATINDTDKQTENPTDIMRGGETPPKKRHCIARPNSDDEGDSVADNVSVTSHTLRRSNSPWQPEVSSTNQIEAQKQPHPQPVVLPPELEYHEIFQPSATPSHLTHRFMVYNMVGMVSCHNDDDTISMVEIEFHNASTYHSFSVPNNIGWTMASLSEQALLLAIEKIESEPSQFQCTVFTSWDNDKDWSCVLPKGESIDVVCMGDGWIAVATDKQYIRLYSLGGVQREVISSPGQIVTMAGRDSSLAVVYQTTPSSPLTFWLLNIQNGRQIYSPHILPVSPNAKLEWIGFSEHDIPVTYDSKGIVRTLSSKFGLSWIPVLDCHKALANKGDHYFVVGMTHNPNYLRVVLCKGMNYPPVHPRPVMSNISLSIPLCDLQTEKSEVEEQYLQQLLINRHGDEMSNSEALKPLMKMLALACQSNHEYRAFEIAKMITHEQGLDLALQYSSKSGHFRLARQISILKEKRSLQENEEEEENYEYDYESSRISTHPHSTSTRMSMSRNETNVQIPSSSISERRNTLIRSSHNGVSNGVNRKRYSPTADTGLENDHGGTESEEVMGEVEEEEEEVEEEMESESNKPDLNTSNVSLFSSPQPTGTTTSNPFKIATPVSKQIKVDRRSSFLDKLCHEVEEEEEKKRKKSGNNKGDKKSVSSSVQKSKKNKKSVTTSKNTKLSSFSFTKKVN